MTHQLIASPYPEGHVVVRPGYDGGSPDRGRPVRRTARRACRRPGPRLARRAGPRRVGRGPDRPPDPRHDPGPAGDRLRVRPRQLRAEPRLQLRLRALLPRGKDVRRHGLARPGAAARRDGRRRGAVAPAHRRRAADRPAVRRDPRRRLGHGHDDPDLLQRITAGPAQDPRPADDTPAVPADAEPVRGHRGVLRRDDPPPGIVPPVHARARRRPRGGAADADQHRRVQPQRPRDPRR